MIKKGLGKGLNALLSIYDEEEEQDENVSRETKPASTGIEGIDISLIYANPNQPRKTFDETALKELATSIKTHGIIQPIVLNRAEDGKYMIIAGERRWRAAKMAGLEQVPAFVRNYTPKQIKEISIIENLQREDLNPIEAARAIKQLMDEYDLTQEAVADRIGKSRPAIANTLRLLNLPMDVIELIEKNKLSAGHARCLVALSSPIEQTKVAQAAVAKKLSVREMEKLVKNLLNPVKERPKTEQSLELRAMIEEMQRTFATKVSAIGNDNKGRIYIDYYSKDDLDRIAELIQLINKKTLTLKDLSLINKK
ncbi:MAG: ParB/RepB/Spo0J family partition protein [Firmicutes bacterium]|nr:ParB/RepB/Spo0J family partition protein [Bacillota bacterium]MDY5586269.1 ParB/RepB/Spo0J family partition protein [Eubacteriales bacterium]